MTLDTFITIILIFVLRVLNYAIGTVRLVAITRDRRLLAAVLAALEALIFAVVIAGVVKDLQNIPNLTAYCLGAAVGSWVGMEIERRLVRGYAIVNIFATDKGEQLAERLRNEGFGVTLTHSMGRDGVVMMLRSVVDKRDVQRLDKVVNEVNDKAVVVFEEVRGLKRGYMGLGRGGRHV